MKEYLAKEIRNVVILGHMGSGKTSLAESFLYVSKAITKKGEVERKNTVSDWLPEEQYRLTTLSTSLIPLEWKNYKLNVLDTPGSEEFVGEHENVLHVVNSAVILLDATKGVEVGTERVWNEASKRNLPTILFVNKMDKENVKVDRILESIKNTFGQKAIPLCWPLGGENNFQGFFNIINKKEYRISGDTTVEGDLSGEALDKYDELYEKVVEAVAETSEELLEKFFGGEELTQEELNEGLRTGVLSGDIIPIVFGSAVKNVGVHELLNMMNTFLPSPLDGAPKTGINPKTGDKVTRLPDENAPFSGYVFKTIIDPFLGTMNLFYVASGNTKGLSDAYWANKDQVIKIGQFVTLMGKTQISVDVLHAGDIGVALKMDLETGSTFCDRKDQVLFDEVAIPTPIIFVAIGAKTKQDEDKISNALQRLNIEDPSFEIKRNPETSQLLIGGQGMTHIGYILDKMKNMYRVDVDIMEPKIVYRETIRKVGSAQGRHKKQSGGAGQFGDVWIRFEPIPEGFEFASEVVGGAVPKNFFPAVEKGLIETLEHGPLAGFPVIGVRAVLYDGSYHPVDSNEISFKLAASLAFKEACKTIRPTILEPIMEVEVTVKDDYVGDIMGDMNKRRGQVLGIEPRPGGRQVVFAQVPEAEIIKYATDLKAMTQGSGHFTRKFVRYEEVPEQLIAKIVEEYKKQ